MTILFKSTKILEAQIEEFLDAVSQGALVFQQAIKRYLENDKEKFAESLTSIKNLESKADDLRRRIESHLYTHSLIPEHRGDVLGLLESMDNVIDTAKSSVNAFSVESPVIQTEVIKDFWELTENAALAAESIVLASRSFFRDVKTVKDYLHKVYFYEKEADKIAEHLKRQIFGLKIDLSKKMHLGYFVTHVDLIADEAEGVADRLSIYAIKRNI